MNNLRKLSVIVLEAIMSDCLKRMEGSDDPVYIEQQIEFFREVEQEILKRKDCKRYDLH